MRKKAYLRHRFLYRLSCTMGLIPDRGRARRSRHLMDSNCAIATHDLRKVYGAKAAVDGLNLEVARGCFFGFLGPNGAGKTTTIRMLMGLAPPTSGHIELLGMPMPERSIDIKQ